MKGLCVKVSKSESNWYLNSTFGGYDCTGSEQHSDPFDYKKIAIDKEATIEDYAPFYHPRMVFKVRSGHDPYFLAEHVTGSSAEFGMHKQDLLVL